MNQLGHTAAIILAAGRGTRMKAKNKNKVAFNLGGKPMITRAVDNLKSAGIGQIIVVVGFQSESVKRAIGTGVEYAVQKEQLGTGDALKSALPLLRPDITSVLSVYGDDSAFYPISLYQEMVDKRQALDVPLIFLTLHKEDPHGLGRIIRNANGEVQKIVEEKNASEQERLVQEINPGFYCFDRHFLDNYIGLVKRNPLTGEFYATDMVEIALSQGLKVEAMLAEDDSIWHGVNSRSDFARAQARLRHE